MTEEQINQAIKELSFMALYPELFDISTENGCFNPSLLQNFEKYSNDERRKIALALLKQKAAENWERNATAEAFWNLKDAGTCADSILIVFYTKETEPIAALLRYTLPMELKDFYPEERPLGFYRCVETYPTYKFNAYLEYPDYKRTGRLDRYYKTLDKHFKPFFEYLFFMFTKKNENNRRTRLFNGEIIKDLKIPSFNSIGFKTAFIPLLPTDRTLDGVYKRAKLGIHKRNKQGHRDKFYSKIAKAYITEQTEAEKIIAAADLRIMKEPGKIRNYKIKMAEHDRILAINTDPQKNKEYCIRRKKRLIEREKKAFKDRIKAGVLNHDQTFFYSDIIKKEPTKKNETEEYKADLYAKFSEINKAIETKPYAPLCDIVPKGYNGQTHADLETDECWTNGKPKLKTPAKPDPLIIPDTTPLNRDAWPWEKDKELSDRRGRPIYKPGVLFNAPFGIEIEFTDENGEKHIESL